MSCEGADHGDQTFEIFPGSSERREYDEGFGDAARFAADFVQDIEIAGRGARKEALHQKEFQHKTDR